MRMCLVMAATHYGHERRCCDIRHMKVQSMQKANPCEATQIVLSKYTIDASGIHDREVKKIWQRIKVCSIRNKV